MLFVLTGARDHGTWNRTVALDIVEELGFLPLAIEQAAAYISQICSHNVLKFLSRYNENRATIHKRVPPAGGRQYSYSIATT